MFVPFPNLSTGDGGPAEAFFPSHKDAIEAAIAKMAAKGSPRADVAVVEGTFAGRAETGVLFLRAYPDANESAIDAAVARVAEIATTNPATPPEVTCAAPVLERVIAHYPLVTHLERSEPSYE